jgi:hypothetical protein
VYISAFAFICSIPIFSIDEEAVELLEVIAALWLFSAPKYATAIF